MIKGIYHSAAGMVPRYIKLSSISNNLANVNTTGFKVDKVHFGTILNNELTQPFNKGLPERELEREMLLQVRYDQGSFEHTKRPTQLALHGNGFFVVQSPDTTEEFYTRNGNFIIDAEKELVNSDGFHVMLESGQTLKITGDKLGISEDGQVLQDGTIIGKLKLVSFEDLNCLVKRGDSLYSCIENEVPIKADEVTVLQGYLETSNVNPIQQMVELITLNRTYESSQRALIAQDDTLKKAVQQVAKFA